MARHAVAVPHRPGAAAPGAGRTRVGAASAAGAAVKPPDFIPQLESIPFLYLFLGVIVLGIVLDVRARRLRLIASQQLLVVLVFWFWCLVTIALYGTMTLLGPRLGIRL